MDKKEKIMLTVTAIMLCALATISSIGQDITQIRLMGRQYLYGAGNDSITLFFNAYNEQGEQMGNLPLSAVNEWLEIREEDQKYPVAKESGRTFLVGTEGRIPDDYTFSVLVDLSIPDQGKQKIYEAIEKLVLSAPDSCVFLSFFGDEISSSRLASKDNIAGNKMDFSQSAKNKYFYSALYSKISEFNSVPCELDEFVVAEPGYIKNSLLAARTKGDKEPVLIIFTDGYQRPSFEAEIGFAEVTQLQSSPGLVIPRTYAFYYTENGSDAEIAQCLEGVCCGAKLPESSRGDYMPAQDIEKVLHDFEHIINEKSYDYAFRYQAYKKNYSGQTGYVAYWKGVQTGVGTFSIGSPERPWPEREESGSDSAVKIIVALLIALCTIAIYLLVIKILIPWVRSKSFERKYYKYYVPEPNVQRRVCHYCRQEITEGQQVVVRCSHVMHVECWRQNGYKCSEYGQNCKVGIQHHVEKKDLFSKNSLRESLQVIYGIVAAFVSWIIFELCGRGGFGFIARGIVKLCLGGTAESKEILWGDCLAQTSAFLMIGFLLGFFLSLVFRYNDEYRKKDWKLLLKIVGLSLLTGIVGLVAFGLGAMVFCGLVSLIGTGVMPWYCSLPAYLFFSLALTAALTFKSSIPWKSAMIGGGIAALIGFLVLWVSSLNTKGPGWLNMLLDFIIYGGGMGASLVTVRMLAEKYFLIIKNGVRAGQKIPIHKWMNATGGGNKVKIGITGECEIQMNWEKSNKVAKEHAVLYIDQEKKLPIIKPMATNVIYNNRMELPVGKPAVLSNEDTFKIGDTIFQYVESE